MTAVEWREHREALEAWRDSYRRYVDAGPGGSKALREDLDALTPGAERALDAADYAVGAPPGNTLADLLVWLHDERRRWALASELLDMADGLIDQLREREST